MGPPNSAGSEARWPPHEQKKSRDFARPNIFGNATSLSRTKPLGGQVRRCGAQAECITAWESSRLARLKSQPGVFRCKLRPETKKAKPEHSDYSGTLLMANGERANVRVWVHGDGTLGLRVALALRREATCH